MYKEEFNFFEGLDFHHIGYACKSIEKELIIFELIGFSIEGEFFEDKLQGIRGCFIKGNGPRIELLENLPNSNQLSGLISKGINMYHLAYKVNSIEDSINELLTKRAKMIVNPMPSVAFNGKKIAFLLFKNGLIIELIQK